MHRPRPHRSPPYRHRGPHPPSTRQAINPMTAANVDIHTKDGCVRIVISGEIDLANAAGAREDILAAVSNQATAVSIDLTDLTYMDSTALQILFHVAERIEDLQIPLELVAPPDSNARLVIAYSGLESLAQLRSNKATEF